MGTQLCKHYLENNKCPLAQYCQFAHGQDDLRQPNDPLPKNFGKTALGAVHSNYKTIPCKYWTETGECKFGEGCSFLHGLRSSRSTGTIMATRTAITITIAIPLITPA